MTSGKVNGIFHTLTYSKSEINKYNKINTQIVPDSLNDNLIENNSLNTQKVTK